MNPQYKSLSDSIKAEIKRKNMTLLECCNAFNKRYKEEISTKKIKPLNKDFLSRVTLAKFKVYSTRISKLCEFLGIDSKQSTDTQNTLIDQIYQFEEIVRKNPSYKKKFPQILCLLDALKTNSTGVTQ